MYEKKIDYILNGERYRNWIMGVNNAENANILNAMQNMALIIKIGIKLKSDYITKHKRVISHKVYRNSGNKPGEIKNEMVKISLNKINSDELWVEIHRGTLGILLGKYSDGGDIEITIKPTRSAPIAIF